MRELFAIALIVIVAVVFFGIDLRVLDKFTFKEHARETTLFSLLEEAKEKGYSEGAVAFQKGTCLDDFIPVSYPCEEKKGLYMNSMYCFEESGFYLLKIRKNRAGGLCISVEGRVA